MEAKDGNISISGLCAGALHQVRNQKGFPRQFYVKVRILEMHSPHCVTIWNYSRWIGS